MKFVILFTILSFLVIFISLYLICKFSLETKQKKKCSKISVAASAVLVFLLFITFHIHRRLDSTSTTVICLVIAAVTAIAAIIYASIIQHKIAARASNKTR